jgi:hypothetical protein
MACRPKTGPADYIAREGFLEEFKNMKFLRSQRNSTSVITRDKNDWSLTPFRPNPVRNIEPGTVRQLVIPHKGIKRFLFDGSQGISNRLACLDLIFAVIRHIAASSSTVKTLATDSSIKAVGANFSQT